MRNLLALTLSFVTLSITGALCQSPVELLRQEIAQLAQFETAIDTADTPGYLVGVIDGRNDAILSFGSRQRGASDTIEAVDVFELGSVTKLLTAALCATLAERNVLGLNTDIAEYLPEEYRNTHDYKVTLNMLLAHLSGLPREPTTLGEMGDPLQQRYKVRPEEILAEYRDLRRPDEMAMLYSHVGYALIEPALYYTTGQSYDELLDEYIVTPLGMTHTGAEVDLTVPGYGLDGKPESACDYGYFAASGGVRSTMVDLMMFVRYSLTDAPEILFEKHGPGLNKYLGMGLGWHIVYPKAKFTVHTHTGRSPGHSAFLAIARQTGTAVVILSNSSNGTEDLGLEILRIMNRNWKRKK